MREAGEDVPERPKPPILHPSLMMYVNAFYLLSTERQASMGGVMPIPWSRVRMYAERNCITVEQISRMERYILHMDLAYLAVANEKIK